MQQQDLSGQTLGRYQIRQKLGAGGMGVVYLAYDPDLDVERALKVLPPNISDDQFRERFIREAKIAAALQHPHIVAVTDYGTENNVSYVVMRLLTGGSLEERIKARPNGLPISEVTTILTQIASALHYAHRKGVLHRDIKPANILFDEEGFAKLADFGIARLMSAATRLTGTGMVVGTPRYIPPESIQNKEQTPAGDQYSLAIVAFEMLSGRAPFEADTPHALMFQHVQDPVPDITALRRELPAGIQAVLEKALAKEPTDRYATITDFARAFAKATGEQASDSDTRLEPMPDVAVGGGGRGRIVIGTLMLLLILGLGLVAFQFLGGDPAEPTAVAVEMTATEPPAAAQVASETPAPPSATPESTTTATDLLTAAPTRTDTLAPTLTNTLTPEPTATGTLTPEPTVTNTGTPIPTETPTEEPTIDVVAVVQTLDAEGTAAARLTAIAADTRAVADATATATLWTNTPTPTLTPSDTPTPTPNATATVSAFLTQRAATETQAWIDSWTDTPMATLTPTATIPPTLDVQALAPNPVTRNADWTPVERDFDGVTMVLVPAGCFMMGSEDGGSAEAPVHEQCFNAPFWIDKYEVTNEQYGSPGEWWGDDLPRESVNWFEARDHCESRGARLPTEREWEYAARGPDNLVYPWGNEWNADNANWGDTSPGETLTVGSFPDGVSWVGAYDLSGNVWEWVSSSYEGYPYDANDGRELDTSSNTDIRRVLRGGSWVNLDGFLLRAAERSWDDPAGTNVDDGFRCARSAASATNSDIEAAADSANPIELARTPVTRNTDWTPVERDFDGVTMVLVPAGCFMMGSDDGSNDEQPVHEQCFNEPFWIDKYEVTNAQYGSVGCESQSSNPDEPRNCIDWFEARDHCEARGARLPTEREWEYAARGPDNLVYPWGDTYDPTLVIGKDDPTYGDTHTAPVGSRPGGGSWTGALDLSGNVWEWTSSLYEEYEYSPDHEIESDTSNRHVLRGGTLSDASPNLRSADRFRYDPGYVFSYFVLGFRCARSL